MASGGLDAALEYACDTRMGLFPFLAFGVIILLLAMFSSLYVEPGTAGYVVLQIDIAITTVAVVLTAATILACSRRE